MASSAGPAVLGRVFLFGLAWRVAALVAVLAAVSLFFVTGRLGAATILVGCVAALLVFSLWRYIQRTNHEVARFVDAMTYADFAASFGHKREGFGFEQLGSAMNAAVSRLRIERAAAADTNRTLAALVEEVPIPLLSLDAGGRVELLNKAARRMFSAQPLTAADGLPAYGARFAADVERAPPSAQTTTQLLLDETPVTATLSVAEVRQPGAAPLRLVAVQPIQSELDRVEMAAWRDLVRVLTHEIMNSVTPITSLARTAADVIGEVESADPRIADARAAIETVARRADGVMHFVQTYRQISRAPPLRRQTVAVGPLVAELQRLFQAEHPAPGVGFIIGVTPASLDMFADPDLIAQVLINLLRNAAEAAIGHAAHPAVTLTAHRNRHGRAVIEIADNGPGVPPGRADEIFLPFFTTKASGTGVGLSLARQIVLAHGGSLGLAETSEGALFRLVI